MASGKRTLYDVLGISRDASLDEVGRAHRRIVAEMRRDTAPPDPRREVLVREAYEVLSDPQRRDDYDKSLRRATFLGASGGERPRRRGLAMGVGIAAALGVLAYFLRGPGTAPVPTGPVVSEQEIRAAVVRSVGRVSRIDPSGTRSGLGMAVATEPGIMTAPCAGLAPGSQILVRIPPRDIPGQVASETGAGLCKLAVADGASWPLPVTQAVPRKGERIYAVIQDANGEATLAAGEVKRVTAMPAGYAIDATARAGKPLDGSPLLDAHGRVVAVALDGEHRTLPPDWVGETPPPRPAEPPQPLPEEKSSPATEDPRLRNLPPERRERLEKAFRPPPTVPSDL